MRFAKVLAVWCLAVALALPAWGQASPAATGSQRASPAPPALPPPPPPSALKPIQVPAKDQVKPSNPLQLPKIDQQSLMLTNPDQIHLLNGLQSSEISNWSSLLKLSRGCLDEKFIRVAGLRSEDALRTALGSPNNRPLVQSMVDTSFRYALLADMVAKMLGKPRVYRMNLAREYDRLGLYAMAQAVCRDIIVNDPHNTEAYRMSIGLEMKVHALAPAFNDLKKLTAIDPRDDWAWTKLAELHMLTANFSKAHHAVERALAVNPNNPEAKWLLGQLEHPAQVAPPSALARAEEAQKKAGTPDALIEQGQAAMKAGHLKRADAAFDAAIKVDGRCWAAYMGKGDVSFRSSDFFKAVDAYARAVQLASDSAEPLYHMALACEMVYQTKHNVPYLDRALQCLQRALQIKPNDADARAAMQRVMQERASVGDAAP